MRQKHEEYLYSPYKMNGINERVFTTRSDETLTVDPDSGQYYAIRKVSKDKRTLHDELVYTKLFVDSLGQLMELSPSGLKLMIYAMCRAKPLAQLVILTEEDACNVCGFSISSFWNAVYELLGKKMISRKLGSNIEFWFDPNIFFNGNRIRVSKHQNDSSLNLLDEV
jgi:hypothetical protein